MKEVKFNWKQANERESAIKARINEIADTLEKDEKRESYTDSEKRELADLNKELNILQSRMIANTKSFNYEDYEDKKSLDEQMRETLKANQRFELTIKNREAKVTMATDIQNGGLAPLTIQDIVEPLYEGLILSKIGAPLMTGLTGDVQWPVVENVEAQIAGEGVELGDTKIPTSKLQARPERMGVTIPVTSQAVWKSNGVINTIVKQQMPQAITALMNHVEFATEKVAGATELAGPFVSPKDDHIVKLKGALPTYAELMKMVGIAAGTGIIFDGTECFVMPAGTFYALKATPKNPNGQGDNMIVDDNGRIGGIPVFTTHYIGVDANGNGSIGFGSFHYNPVALFGDFRLVVDPYSAAAKDEIRFTLNVDFATTVLRKEAFVLATPALA